MSAPIDEAREPMTTEHIRQLVNLARAVRAMWGHANNRERNITASGNCADAIVRLGEEVLTLRAQHALLADAALQSVCVVIPARIGGPFAAVRSRKHGGATELPGGKVEPGEGAREAAHREVWEEVGVDLDPDRMTPLGTFLHVFEGRLWRATAFLGDIGGAQLCDGDAGEAMWATRDELLAGTYGAVVAKIFAALDAPGGGS